MARVRVRPRESSPPSRVEVAFRRAPRRARWPRGPFVVSPASPSTRGVIKVDVQIQAIFLHTVNGRGAHCDVNYIYNHRAGEVEPQGGFHVTALSSRPST